MPFFERRNVRINASDLALLEGFLHKDIVFYFIRRVDVVANGQLIFFSKNMVVYVIIWLQKQAAQLGRKFFELSFQQKKELVDKLISSGQLDLIKK